MNRDKRRRGFTMVEIMIVIGIIAILLAIAVPSYKRARDDSRIKRVDSELQMIAAAIRQLSWDTGKWPNGAVKDAPGSTEVWLLTPNSAGLMGSTSTYTGWKGPYLPTIRKDPWGKDFFFDPDYLVKGVNRVVVGSFGPNKVGQNLYDKDDRYVVLQ